MLYLHNDSTQINSGCANGGAILLHVVKGDILGFFNALPAVPPLQEEVISGPNTSKMSPLRPSRAFDLVIAEALHRVMTSFCQWKLAGLLEMALWIGFGPFFSGP